MNDKDQQRLAELQKESRWSSERLSRSDLLLLLQADPEVQEVIRQLIVPAETVLPVLLPEPVRDFDESSACDQLAITLPAPAALPAPREDGLRAVLAPELQLLAWIEQDRELSLTWLGAENDGERRLVRLIAVAAQWDRLLLLWDRLASRCKEEARPASRVEQQILSRCLALHNLIWQGRQASLQVALPGESFDPLRHERGILHGDHVCSEWLSGLCNAAGQLQRKPLVGT